jgi:hypothetical protein
MDISQSNWKELDSDNDAEAPDGAPEGMAPGGLNDTIRAIMGAVKRGWNRANAVKTTGGTSGAFTLAYDQTPAAYADGEITSFVVHAANAAAATLNVNALGAIPLRLFGGNLMAGALAANQIVQARYNTSAGAFDILTTQGWNVLATSAPSAATEVDFTAIPAGVNNLRLAIEVRPSTDGADMQMRTYGADGNIDTGASDYTWGVLTTNGSSGVVAGSGTTAAFIAVTNNVDNGAWGFQATLWFNNIQSATNTKYTSSCTCLGTNGTDMTQINGFGG